MKIERTKNTVRNMFWGILNRLLGLLLPFALRTVMIKVLGNEYLGINSLFTSVLQVLSLSELGFGTAIVYSMYEPIAKNDNDKICVLLNFYKKIYRAVGIIIIAVGTIILPLIPKLISGSYPSDINIYFVYYMFLLNTGISYFLYAYKTSLLSAFQRNDIDSNISSIILLLQNAVQIALIILLRNYYYYLYVLLAFTVTHNFVNLAVTNKYFPDYNPKGTVPKNERKVIWNNVGALACHRVGGTILNSADSIVISATLGLTVLAQYTNYYYIMNAVEQLINICFAGMTAGIGNSFVTETIEKNRNDFNKVLFFNGFIDIVCGTIMVTLYQDFIHLWVGEDNVLSNNIVALMLIYFFIHSIRRTIITYRDAAGVWKDNQWQPITSGFFNLVVNIILVNLIGLPGIIISSIASMILIDIPWETHTFCMNKLNMKDSLYIIQIVTYLGVLLLCSGISCYLCSFLHFHMLVNLLVKLMVSAILSVGIFVLIFHSRKEFGYYIGLIRTRVLHRE